TFCLLLTPLLIETTLQLKRNPIPYLIGLACASNVGSAATITGNPQNMIIGAASGIPFSGFFLALAPISLAGLVVVWGVIMLFYRQEFSRTNPLSIPAQSAQHPAAARFQIMRVLLVTAGMLTALLLGVPTATAAFIAACLLLISRVNTPEMVFGEINWSLLVFFAGLFVISGALELNGITARLFELVDVSKNMNTFSLSAYATLLSNLVSNVPAVLLLKPVILRLADPRAGWLTLAAASTLAGNLTLLGSVANLIVAEIAQAWRVELRFGEYTRAGIVITLSTLLIAVGWRSWG
ncbi:MAG: SLC13 family permease, partial [Anaerolineaceae bacterium]